MQRLLSIARYGLLGLLLFTLCTSCQEDTEDSLFTRIIGNKEPVFRGVDMRMSPGEVKDLEAIPPSEEDDRFLYYDIRYQEGQNFTISYSFDQNGLYEILVDIYLDEEGDADHIYDRLKDYLNNDLTKTNEHQTATSWSARSAQSPDIEVNLINESIDVGYGKVSLSFYDIQ